MEPTLNAAPQSYPRGKSTLMPRIGRALAQRFSLLSDKADDAEIERRIRDGVELSDATPWILVFAILVASVGLNVNSTAVIIGAMLISPLMAPIMGASLGAAVYDFVLVSALYFALTPLQDAQSDLLARTTPTIWDVLIALFGGLAGVISMTRQEKSNLIPGVAIATALMPPACTGGVVWPRVSGSFLAVRSTSTAKRRCAEKTNQCSSCGKSYRVKMHCLARPIIFLPSCARNTPKSLPFL